MIESSEKLDESWRSLLEKLPEAELPIEGLRGRILKCGDYWVLFMEALQDVIVPEHHHGAQWGVVLCGRMDLTIANACNTYHKGEFHFIPENVDHQAVLYEGWHGLYIFTRQETEQSP